MQVRKHSDIAAEIRKFLSDEKQKATLVRSTGDAVGGQEAEYELTWDLPGFDHTQVRCVQTHSSLTFECSIGNGLRIPFDREYLNLMAWTVKNGVLRARISYKLPEKYRFKQTITVADPGTYETVFGKLPLFYDWQGP